MAPDPILHERIYADLKAAVRSGRLLPEQHIDLNAIADVHRASVTPVREVVCRLVGEGLADFQRHGGFHAAAVQKDALRGLYMLDAAILSHAIRMSSGEALARALGSFRLPREDASAVDIAMSVATLFVEIGSAAEDFITVHAIENLSDRLAAARIAEFDVLRGLRGELAMIGQSEQLGSSLSRRIARYHRRRIALADMISRSIRASGSSWQGR